MGWTIETGVRRILCSTTAQSRNRLVSPTDEKKEKEKRKEKKPNSNKKRRCSLCGLSVFGVKRELKETAWRSVFGLKPLPVLCSLAYGVVLKLCYLPSAIICAKLVPLCSAPPVRPLFSPHFMAVVWIMGTYKEMPSQITSPQLLLRYH